MVLISIIHIGWTNNPPFGTILRFYVYIYIYICMFIYFRTCNIVLSIQFFLSFSLLLCYVLHLYEYILVLLIYIFDTYCCVLFSRASVYRPCTPPEGVMHMGSNSNNSTQGNLVMDRT